MASGRSEAGGRGSTMATEWNSGKAAKLLKDMTAYIAAARDRWYSRQTIKKLNSLWDKIEAARQAADFESYAQISRELYGIRDKSIREYCSKAADGRLVWEYVAYAVKAFAEHEAEDGQAKAFKYAFTFAHAAETFEHWDEMEKRPALKPIIDILGKI